MKVFSSIYEYIGTGQSVVTIGTFDGVHVGHLKVIDRLLRHKEVSKTESLLLTFFPHPRMVLSGAGDVRLLNTLQERIDLLSLTGLDNLVVHPFDQQFSELSAEDFVCEVLVKRLRASKVIVGHDHRFGHGRTAGFEDLQRFGNQYEFTVEQIPAQELDDITISSTKIRHALQAGEIKKANDYLGYPFLLSGTVVHGKHLGQTLGFPTANIEIAESYKLIPGHGVYLVHAELQGNLLPAVANIGTRPTIEGERVSVEVHLLDYNEDLYGKILKIHLLDRIRDEKKFNSLQQLTQQIAFDVAYAKKYFGA
jgi:riboflavin kinase / FMN adenylyltransferase